MQVVPCAQVTANLRHKEEKKKTRSNACKTNTREAYTAALSLPRGLVVKDALALFIPRHLTA